jgi:hypothetical protein
MNLLSRFLPAVTLLLSVSAAWAGVNVTYVKPEEFFDIPALQRDRVLKDINDHFTALGARLPPGQNLEIEITALVLAGRTIPQHRTAEEIRVLKGGADWPSMHLRYRLESNGQVTRRGEDDLANMMYLQRMNNYPQNENLRYEKQMIDDWFSARFGTPVK